VQTAAGPRLPWLTLSALAALLALAPYAMSFTPFSGIYTYGPYAAPYATDPLQARRVALVSFGLLTTLMATAEAAWILLRHRTWTNVFIYIPPWFACAVLGWRSLPYWSTGVYAAWSGSVPWTDLDPKGLIPMTWLGEYWRTSVLSLYPLAPCVVLMSLAGGYALASRRRPLLAAVSFGSGVIAVVFLAAFSPNYSGWLLD
jgi:hypothetical protein